MPEVEEVEVTCELPKGVVNLTGNLYTIDPTDLVFADGGFNPDSDKLEYRNIRYALSQEKLVGKGLDREKMLRLIERIRTEGLHQYPICRWFNGAVQVVDGERRSRAIRKLIADNAQCWDKKTKSWVPAKELYAKLPVFIFEMTDEEALRVNFSASESGEDFGDGAIIAYVKYLRHCDMEDKGILYLTGYSSEWLKQTDKLCNLDEKCFTALSEGKITRGLASELLEIEEVPSRLEILEQRIAKAEKRHAEMTKELTAKVETAKDTLETAAADEVMARHENGGDEAETSQKKKRKAAQTVETAEDKLKKHQDTQPKAGAKTGTEPKPLTYVKVEKFWLEPVIAAIKNDCKDENGEEIALDLEDLRLAKFFCEQMRKGQKDIIKVLVAHKKHKIERATKVQDE
jgi:hypothetical protein